MLHLFIEAGLHWLWVEMECAVRRSVYHYCLGVNIHPGLCPVSNPSVYTHCFSLGSDTFRVWCRSSHLGANTALWPKRNQQVGGIDLLCNFCATLQPAMLQILWSVSILPAVFHLWAWFTPKATWATWNNSPLLWAYRIAISYLNWFYQLFIFQWFLIVLVHGGHFLQLWIFKKWHLCYLWGFGESLLAVCSACHLDLVTDCVIFVVK